MDDPYSIFKIFPPLPRPCGVALIKNHTPSLLENNSCPGFSASKAPDHRTKGIDLATLAATGFAAGLALLASAAGFNSSPGGDIDPCMRSSIKIDISCAIRESVESASDGFLVAMLTPIPSPLVISQEND